MAVRPQKRRHLCFMVLEFLVGTGRRSALAFLPFSASISGPPIFVHGSCIESRRCRAHMTPLKRGLSLRATAGQDNSDDDREGLPDCSDTSDGDDEKELVGLADFYARKAERESGGGAPAEELGLEGGIFPGDVSPSFADKDIKLQAAKLDPGQPQALVGFWQLYGTTGNREDVSGRLILRADGQVVGGPAVRRTPEVEWSDPEGLRPVGGHWEVYKDDETGRTRLEFTIILSFQKKQQLEMDGVVMIVDAWDDITGGKEHQPQVFGSVLKRNGDGVVEGKAGDFSMMKVSTGDDGRLVATVGSQRKRMW